MAETLISKELQAEELAELRAWAGESLAARGALPAACEDVQSRLIRSVGRGRLASGRLVYLKLMAFPRGKDALRYIHRSLPAEREARSLLRLAAGGIDCPRPLYVQTQRRCLRPHFSFLAMTAIETEERQPDFAEYCALTARLTGLGLFHPDLNPGNFLCQKSGGLALIDLQSARWRAAPLAAGLRMRMAAKLWLESGKGKGSELMVAAGLLQQEQLPAVLAEARRLRIAFLRGRVLRCLQTSSEFECRRSWRGTMHRRRDRAADHSLEGGRELRQLWIGDRAREILLSEQSQLSALFLRSWWSPGRSALYFPKELAADRLSSERSAQLAAFEEFQALEGAIRDPGGAAGRRS